MGKRLTQHYTGAPTQAEPIGGQVENSSGAFVYEVDKWTRLNRFLILGTEGGSYYASERFLTRENSRNVLECIAENGRATAEAAARVIAENRAHRYDVAIFVLALVSIEGDEVARHAAFKSVSDVVRTFNQLATFTTFRQDLGGGWGRSMRKCIDSWYANKGLKGIAYQGTKYPKRGGWTQRDVLLKSHAIDEADAPSHSTERGAVQGRIIGKGEALNIPTENQPNSRELLDVRAYLDAVDTLQHATTPEYVIGLIESHSLPHEVVPQKWQNNKTVMAALANQMQATALIRNLPRLSNMGVIERMGETEEAIAVSLADAAFIQKGMIHPLTVLAALTVYQTGQNRNMTWVPSRKVVDALDAAFYHSFGNVDPTNTRTLLALDVSGSMSMSTLSGIPSLTPRVASAAMALVTAAVEPRCEIMAFSAGHNQRAMMLGQPAMYPLDISPRERLDDVLRKVDNLPFTRTDCALPVAYAQAENLDIDSFAVYTDSETNTYGSLQPASALHQYRNQRGLNSRMAVVGMVSNGFSIADPNDPGMLDVVGFDSGTPQIMGGFFRGEI